MSHEIEIFEINGRKVEVETISSDYRNCLSTASYKITTNHLLTEEEKEILRWEKNAFMRGQETGIMKREPEHNVGEGTFTYYASSLCDSSD